MKVLDTNLHGVKIIIPDIFGDQRGYFYESYSAVKLKEYGIMESFIQDNHSFSEKPGTLRGLHFQKEPYAQAKIVRCTKGKILDVAVDIRKGSPTYCQWVSVELTEENFKQLYIPAGFAHGFLTLSQNVEIQYKTSNCYSPECDRSILWNDPEIHVLWGTYDPILSNKDRNAPLLRDSDNSFIWERER